MLTLLWSRDHTPGATPADRGGGQRPASLTGELREDGLCAPHPAPFPTGPADSPESQSHPSGENGGLQLCP